MRLHDLGVKYGTDKATYHGYCDFYQDHLPHPATFTGRLLEIGVMQGASLRMWREYYPLATIVGVDLERTPAIDGCSVVKMDATDRRRLVTLGDFDVIIDDGSHLTADQQVTFFWLYFNQLAAGGVYVLEDLHTSYMSNYINSRLSTIDMLYRLGVDTTLFARDQGNPETFMRRHGFDDLSKIKWTGSGDARSITAVIMAPKERTA